MGVIGHVSLWFLCAGHNCSFSAEEKNVGYVASAIPFRCDLELTNHQTDISARDIFSVESVFDYGTGMLMHQQVLHVPLLKYHPSKKADVQLSDFIYDVFHLPFC